MSVDFVLGVLVKTTAALLLAWLVTLAMRRASAAARHAVWAAGILAALSMPALVVWLPTWRTPAVHVQAVLREPAPVLVAGSAVVRRETQSVPTLSLPPISTDTQPSRSIPWAALGFTAWALGSMLLLTRLALALWRVRAISAQPLDVGAPRRVRVLEASATDLMPLTWGVFRPRVLFPSGVRNWPASRFRHVLAHELAHIERRDWAVQMVAEAARAVYWFHPLAWFAVSQLRQEAERACDDLVLSSGATALDYAADVVGLARTLKTPPGVMSSTFAAANPSKFEERISAVLQLTLNRRPLTLRVAAVTLLLAAAVLAPIAAVAAGQEVRGKILEAGTNQPVQEAQIIVRKMGPREYNKPLVSEEVTKLKTDAQGQFAFATSDFGEFIFLASKPGYTAAANTLGALQANVTLSKESPTREIAFTMARPATISGRLVDFETGDPIAGLHVELRGMAARGAQFGGDFRNQPTSADGGFSLQATTGTYALLVTPRRLFKDQVITSFTPDEAHATDLDYRSVFLPGGPEYSAALGVPVISGGTADVGNLRLRKERLYRAHVSIGGACERGDEIPIRATLQFGPTSWTNDLGSFRCGSDFLMRDLAPGNYLLIARLGREAATRVSAVARFEVRESNMEIPMTLQRGVTMNARFVAVEGAGKLPMDRLGVQLIGANIPNYAGEIGPYRPDAEGRFRIENVMPGLREPAMIGLDNEYYVKQIRLQGRPLAGAIDFLADGNLEFEIDSNPSTLSGSVRNNDRPVGDATMLFAPWPYTPGVYMDQMRQVVVDDKGEFQVPGLVPGEYRVFAVANSDVSRATAPANLQRLLTSAQTVKLARGGTQTVTLRLTDPGR